MATPRGIRNNNPGNIRWGDEWQGLVSKDKRTDPSFCQFTSPVMGIRALAKVVLNYRKRPGIKGVGNDGIDTIREIISRWAPPNENDTEAYIKSVASNCGVGTDQAIDLTDRVLMRKLVEAIIRHENGKQPYSQSDLEWAVKLAY